MMTAWSMSSTSVLNAIVHSMHTEKSPASYGFLQSILATHQALTEVVRLSRIHRSDFSDEDDLLSKFVNLKIGFANECKFLLFAAVRDHQHVENMFENQRHISWSSTKTCHEMRAILGNYWNLCLTILDGCQTKAKTLHQSVQSVTESKTLWTYGLSWSRIRAKARSLCEPTQILKDSIDTLKAIIWMVLRLQPEIERNSAFSGGLSRRVIQGTTEATHGRLYWVQQASQILNETISKVWFCSCDHYHSLSISLGTRPAESRSTVSLYFNVAVTSGTSFRRYQIAVQSDETRRRQNVEKKLPNTGTLEKRSAKSGGRGYSDEITRMEHRGSGIQKERSGVSPAFTESSHDRMRDLSLEKDLCNYLASSFSSPSKIKARQETGYPCVGYLGTEVGIRFIFIEVSEKKDHARSVYSLKDLLTIAKREQRSFSPEAKLRTASFIAAGVLDMHPTSWFPSVWGSDVLVLFVIEIKHWEDGLECPYIQTKLSNGAIQRSNSPNPAADNHSILYCLAIVLLELAFSATWQDLHVQEDMTSELSDWERELVVLTRLTQTVSGLLGPKYAKVVRTCLHYGITATYNITKWQLDSIILEHIVFELNRCFLDLSPKLGMSWQI